MDTTLLLLRLAVATVFAVAGIAKLFDLAGSVAAVEGFGVPYRLSRPLGTALPIAEILIALALIPVATAPVAAMAGTALMGAFVVAIAVNLARGKRPDCHCFGKLHSAPIGPQTLVRNGAIVLAAGVVAVAGPGMSLVSWLGEREATSLVLLALLVGAALTIGWQWLAYGRLDQRATALVDRVTAIEGIMNGDAPTDVPGPAVGTAAPAFRLASIGRGEVSLDALKRLGKPTVLVFAEPTCNVCTMMMPKLARWSHDLADALTLAVISTGSEEANRRKVERYGLDWVLLQEGREVTMSYRVPGTPSAVLLDRNGVVAETMAYGPDEILALFERISQSVVSRANATIPSASLATAAD